MSLSAATRVLGYVLVGLLLLSTPATAAVFPRLRNMSANAARFGVKQAAADLATADGGSGGQVAEQTANDPIKSARLIPSNADGTLDDLFDASNGDTVEMNMGEVIKMTLSCYQYGEYCGPAQDVTFTFSDETYLMQSTNFDNVQGGYVPGYAPDGDGGVSFGLWQPQTISAAAEGTCICDTTWTGYDQTEVVVHGNQWFSIQGQWSNPTGSPVATTSQGYAWQTQDGTQDLQINFPGITNQFIGSNLATFGILQTVDDTERYLWFSDATGKQQKRTIADCTTNVLDSTVGDDKPITDVVTVKPPSVTTTTLRDPIGFPLSITCWTESCSDAHPQEYTPIQAYDDNDSLTCYLLVQSGGSPRSLASYWVPVAATSWMVSASLLLGADNKWRILFSSSSAVISGPQMPSYTGTVTQQTQTAVSRYGRGCYCPKNS